MAKTLGKLRAQTLKLRDPQAPSSVSKGTKNFVKKHVYVVHPDANENDDDVFKATNVKKYKRSPDHGYETGEDAAVYEDFDRVEFHNTQAKIHDDRADRYERSRELQPHAQGMRELAQKHRNLAARAARAKDSVTMKKGRTRGEDLLGDHRASRRMEGQRIKDRQRTEETSISKARKLEREREGGNLNHGEIKRTASGLHVSKEKKARVKRMERDDAEFRRSDDARVKRMNREETDLDEMKVSPERHAAAWITATPPGERTRSSFGRHMASVGLTHFDTRPFKKGRDIGYNQAKANQDSLLKNLGEAMVPSMPAIYSALSRSSRTARNPSARRPAPQDKGYWKGTLDLTPDMQDPEQKAAMANHPANKKIAGGLSPRPNIRSNPRFAKDLEDMRRRKNGLLQSDEETDYPHIEALSESDQSMLVDIYNSLDEANQDRFLEIAETEEGVDELLDFAIKQRVE